MIAIIFILVISAYFLHRLRKYPTERGLRLPTLFSIPAQIFSIPLIRTANRALRAMTKKEINIHIERKDRSKIPIAFYKRNGKRPLLLYIHGGGFFFCPRLWRSEKPKDVPSSLIST